MTAFKAESAWQMKKKKKTNNNNYTVQSFFKKSKAWSDKLLVLTMLAVRNGILSVGKATSTKEYIPPSIH